MKRQHLINILDPQIRSISKTRFLVVTPKLLRLSQGNNADDKKDQKIREEIRESCRKALVSHDVDRACTKSTEELEESIRNSFYLDRHLVSSSTLKILDRHNIHLTELRAIQLQPTVPRKKGNNIYQLS